MRMTARLGWMLACLLGLFARAAFGSEATLKVGDPAPKLQPSKWLQGEPVTEFKNDKLYVVEFWATWCAPCKESIPHLNELQKKYKDKGVVVIGQDIWEDDDDDPPKFVKQMGEKMTYRVAVDDKSGGSTGKVAAAWMDAAGFTAIPKAFVISNGKVAWIGGPMSLKEPLIDEILGGKYDIAAAAAKYAKERADQEKYDAAFEEFQKATTAKDWTKAEEYLKEMENHTDLDGKADVEMVRLKMNLTKQDMAAAAPVVKRLNEMQPENAGFHGAVAWLLATREGVSKELLDLAQKEADHANDIAKGKDADVLDTLARVQFVRGEKEAAVATEQKAVELAEDGKAKTNYQKTVDAYKAGKIPE